MIDIAKYKASLNDRQRNTVQGKRKQSQYHPPEVQSYNHDGTVTETDTNSSLLKRGETARDFLSDPNKQRNNMQTKVFKLFENDSEFGQEFMDLMGNSVTPEQFNIVYPQLKKNFQGMIPSPMEALTNLQQLVQNYEDSGTVSGQSVRGSVRGDDDATFFSGPTFRPGDDDDDDDGSDGSNGGDGGDGGNSDLSDSDDDTLNSDASTIKEEVKKDVNTIIKNSGADSDIRSEVSDLMSAMVDIVDKTPDSEKEIHEYIKITKNFMDMMTDYTKDMSEAEKRALNALIREQGITALTYTADGKEEVSLRDSSNRLLDIMTVIDASKLRAKGNSDSQQKGRDNANDTKSFVKLAEATELLSERGKDMKDFEINQLRNTFDMTDDDITHINSTAGKTCAQCGGLYWFNKADVHNKTEGHKLISFLNSKANN